MNLLWISVSSQNGNHVIDEYINVIVVIINIMIAKNLLGFAIRNIVPRSMIVSTRCLGFSTQKSQAELLEVVEGKVFEILRSAAKCDQSKLSKSATFEQLGFDSLDSVELVVAMEENFGLDIPNE